MKPFYRKKGKYSDGRDKIVIEDKDSGTSKTLPKPETLIKLLNVHLGDTKCTDLQ